MFKTIRKQPVRHLVATVIGFAAGFLMMRSYHGHYDNQSMKSRY